MDETMYRLFSIFQYDPDDSYSTATAPPVTSLDKATFAVTVVLRAIVVFLCIIMLVLCIWKRKRQPLKSRKFIPVLFLVSKAFANIAVVQSAWPAGWNSYDLGVNSIVGCYIQLWGTNVLYIINMLCVIFMFCRFFSLRAYEKRKERHQLLRRESACDVNQLNKSRTHRVSKAIKFFTDPLLLFFAISLSVLSIYVVGAIDVGRTNGTCSDSWAKYTAKGVPAAVLARYEIFVVVVIALVGLILVFMDLIFNGHLTNLCTCKMTPRKFFKNLFFEDDPLRYRLELYSFAFPALALGVIVGAFGIVSTVTTRSNYIVLLRNILYVFLWDIPSLLAIPGVVLISAFKWQYRENHAKNEVIAYDYEMKPSSPGGEKGVIYEETVVDMPSYIKDMDITEFNDSADMIHRILGCGDVEAKQIFKNFTSKEFSVENVLCYDDIQTYQSKDTFEARYKQAVLIFDSYLEKNSVNEVNIPRKFIENARESVKVYAANPAASTMDNTLFDSIMQQIVVNLTDSYMRMYYSDAWQELRAKRKKM